jgi:hypothetical protein
VQEEEEEELTSELVSFFLSRSSTNLRTSSSLLFAYLSNAELIIDCTSSRESDGLGRTSGVTSTLRMMIGDEAMRMTPYRVTSQRE